MDKFDQKIVDCLCANARQSNADIARTVGLSRTAVSERIRKLEEQGVIQGYRASIKPASSLVSAYFQLSFTHSCCEEVAKVIRPFKEVKQCHSTSGEVDMMIFAEAESIAELNKLRLCLEGLPHLTRLITHTVLEERIRR